MINVTKAYLPDKKKYKHYIDEIYANGWITNNGPLLKKLEQRLAEYLGVKNIVLVANGTAALEIAYRMLDIKDYVITTPFSFVATTSSLVTNNMNPVICPDNQCNAISEGRIIFRDNQHLSSSYVKSLEEDFLRELEWAKNTGLKSN